VNQIATAVDLLQAWLDYYQSDRLTYPPDGLTRRFLRDAAVADDLGPCPVCGRSDLPHLHSQAEADWMRSG